VNKCDYNEASMADPSRAELLGPSPLAGAPKARDVARLGVILEVLEYVERGGKHSRRRLALGGGASVGLGSASLDSCLEKG
jgi:hypothetical protein